MARDILQQEDDHDVLAIALGGILEEPDEGATPDGTSAGRLIWTRWYWRAYQSTAWRDPLPTPTLCHAGGWTLLLNPIGTRTRRDNVQSEAEDHMASMAVNELGPMLTATEVADMLHLHVNTVKRLGDRGELPFYRVCKRGDRRFRLDDVMKFLTQNR